MNPQGPHHLNEHVGREVGALITLNNFREPYLSEKVSESIDHIRDATKWNGLRVLSGRIHDGKKELVTLISLWQTGPTQSITT